MSSPESSVATDLDLDLDLDLAVRQRQAREQLDAHVCEIVRWHFDESTGCPFWLEKKSTLKFDPLQDIHQVGVGVDALQATRPEQALDVADVLGADLGPAKEVIAALTIQCII